MTFFLPYQKKWIEDNSRLKIMEKSRQVGISWASAYDAVRKQATSETQLDVWVSSRDETQAQLFLADCKQFAQMLNLGTRAYETPILSESKSSRSGYLEFNSRTRIHSLSSNPNAQAGKRGGRILDEFALHPNPKELYSIAYPGITWGGQLSIISTHRGQQNFFNTLLEEIKYGGNPKQISHHKVTLQDALEQGFLKRLKLKLPKGDIRNDMDESTYFDFIKNGCPDTETFLQEYMCTPMDENSFFIPPAIIEKSEYLPEDSWEYTLAEAARSPHALFLGVDLARHQDLTVFCLIEHIHGTNYVRRLDCFKNTPFQAQANYLYQLLDAIPNLACVCVDQSGLGLQFAENAQRRYGPSRIDGVQFSMKIKETLAYSVRTALENKTLRTPPLPEMRADLLSIRKTFTHSGNLLFHAERSNNGHGDRFWALALALKASQQAQNFYHYYPLSKSYTQRIAL